MGLIVLRPLVIGGLFAQHLIEGAGAFLHLTESIGLRANGIARLGALQGPLRVLHRPLGLTETVGDLVEVLRQLAHEFAELAAQLLLRLGQLFAGHTALSGLRHAVLAFSARRGSW